MIFAMRNKTCSLRNLICSTIKINQPIRFESITASRYADHEIIYKFPLVRVASIINRLKFYQTLATGIGMSTTAVLAGLDIVTTETAIAFAISGIAWSISFYSIGFLGQNRVGYIYLRNDQKSVKIAYTDFWGKRVDIDVDIDDIWPLNDLPVTPLSHLYYSLRRYSTKKTLKFNIKYGIIGDPEKFQLVFGDPFLKGTR